MQKCSGAWLLLLLPLLLTGYAAAASGDPPVTEGERCTPSEARSFVRAAKKTARCLLRGRSPCPVAAPPSCSGNALDDFVELAFGEASGDIDAPALYQQRRCQRKIARSSVRFLKARLKERIRGKRSTLRSARKLAPIGRRACDVLIAQDEQGHVLPRMGGSCEDVLGKVGELADGVRAAACLRPGLGRIVEAIAPRSMPPTIIVVMTDDQRLDTLPWTHCRRASVACERYRPGRSLTLARRSRESR